MKTELEQEFEDIVNAHRSEIEEKLNAASKALEEARELSDKYGIPFNTIHYGDNEYVPRSFVDKYSEIDSEFIYDLLERYPSDSYAGWQHSTSRC